MVKHWFDVVVPRRFAVAVGVGIVVWAALVAWFSWMMGAVHNHGQTDWAVASFGFFFSSVVVYSTIAGAFVVRRSALLLDDLPLNCDADQRQALRLKLTRVSGRRASAILGGSLAAGLLHNWLLQDTFPSWDVTTFTSAPAFAAFVGTQLAWVFITTIVIVFMSNARVFNRIGRDFVQVELLQLQRLNPMGRAALLPTLGLLGTQTLYPLLSLDGRLSMLAILPGFSITTVAIVYLFVQTSLPLHRRIATAKQTVLAQLDADIDQFSGRERVVELQALLNHRDYVRSLPEWPFRVGTLARWSLYLLIPPLTWVGAALIENLVDLALG